MCYTEEGLELTRLSCTDTSGAVVYDTLVLPQRPITDYNTEFSGGAFDLSLMYMQTFDC